MIMGMRGILRLLGRREDNPVLRVRAGSQLAVSVSAGSELVIEDEANTESGS